MGMVVFLIFIFILHFFSVEGQRGYHEPHPYKGDGFKEKRKDPYINSPLVYQSLFSEKSFASVFDRTQGGHEECFKPTFNTHNRSLFASKFMKIPVIVKKPTAPITVGFESIYFFWGKEYLPANELTNKCANYLTSNDQRIISFCDDIKMETCSADITELPALSPFKFVSPQRIRFAWLCPAGTTCCRFECCDEREMQHGIDDYPRTALISIASLSVILFIAIVVFFVFRCRQDPQPG